MAYRYGRNNIFSPLRARGAVFLVLILAATFAAWLRWEMRRERGAKPAAVESPFIYPFDTESVLDEAESMAASKSPYWWLDSGARFSISGGTGKTLEGDLPPDSPWRRRYALANPVDTDNGLHPQNIFRLLTRSAWRDFSQEAYFRIMKINMSDSPARNASNGLLLFSRYQDSDNLYYAGIRVDGTAVIKKKQGGAYATMAQRRVFSEDALYNRGTNPNLIPGGQWIGIRSVIENDAAGGVTIRLFIDKYRSGAWEPALEARDDGKRFGGAPINGAGSAGIRTDFADVEFDDYRITAR